MIRFFIGLGLCFFVIGANASTKETATEQKEAVVQTIEIDQQLLIRVDDILEAMESDGVEVDRFMPAISWLESRINMALIEKWRKSSGFSPEDKEVAAKELLTVARYDSLVDVCVKKVASEREDVRLLSIRLLTQTLGSRAGENEIEQKLNEALRTLEGDGPLAISPSELFALAEGSAYLGHDTGVEVLKSALRADETPESIKQRSILALRYLGVSSDSIGGGGGLFSENASVAYTAFSAEPLPCTNRTVIAAAVEQFSRLKNIHESTCALSYRQSLLLGRLALIFRMAKREKALSSSELNGITEVVHYFVQLQDQDLQERVVSLFADLVKDDDSELIRLLLASDSGRVRSAAALAVSNCSPEIIYSFRDTLCSLLEDSSKEVRNFALFALRRGLKKPASTSLSESEFESQKNRTLEEINNNK